MLASQAIDQLNRSLAAAISSMELVDGKLGYPELIEKAVAEASQLFQGYAKANPNTEHAYAAALAFLRGQSLDSWQRDLVASALAEPIREQAGKIVLSSKRLRVLLEFYEVEAQVGDLWRLTWHGLLTSYFAFDPARSKDNRSQLGWDALRQFLLRTWPLIDRQAGSNYVPDWIAVLRQESEVLTDKPVDKYVLAYLAGDTGPADRIAADLGILPSSWFWHALVLGAVRYATLDSDEEFRRLIPRLVQLIKHKPAFRDEAIEQMLVRYYSCKASVQNETLQDYVVAPDVWKNPKLRSAGIAPAWNRVPEPVWLMVLGWVNERNLKDFFDILAARNRADSGRLAFWSKYLKQITWTRLVFGLDTLLLKNRNAEVKNLIAREEGAYSELRVSRDVDAFMMRIGNCLVVEFSKKPNAAYIYRVDTLKFDLNSKYFSGGRSDLKCGYHDNDVLRIVHSGGWESVAEYELKRRGIEPDKQGTSRS